MINYKIATERVAGLLIPISTYNIVTNMINSAITRERVAGIKIPLSTSPITYRHCKNLIIRNIIKVTMVRGRIDGLMRPIS